MVGGLLGLGEILVGVLPQASLEARRAEVGEDERLFVRIVVGCDVARREVEHAGARRLCLAGVPRCVGGGRRSRR